MPSLAPPSALDFWNWFIPREQPARRAFGIRQVHHRGRDIAVREDTVADWPFAALLEFLPATETAQQFLFIPPLSGHFAFLLRDAVIGLLPRARVFVLDWVNARHVPSSMGDFDFDDNIAHVLRALSLLGPSTHVFAVCQGVIPALAATAILAREDGTLAPRSLILMAGPVYPLASPTRVFRLLRERPLDWFRANALARIGEGYPGADRVVYPASVQFHSLLAYAARHLASGLELSGKILNDDGTDRERFPFLDLYASIMDLTAEFFLENVRLVFHERAVCTGALRWQSAPINFGAIRGTALMTIEGEFDDIAAPGQTGAAHALCHGLPPEKRNRHLVPGSGHFSLFHGRRWREQVLPELLSFTEGLAS